jgi:hypothetical protein
MRRMRIDVVLVALVVAFGFVHGAFAGPYSDDLSKCLVGATTNEEKGTLVKWIFSIAALHPAVSSVSAVNDKQRTDLNKATASLFETLLADRCKKQTQDAVKYEGTNTIQEAFGVLGQAAMMELFTNDAVAGGLQEFAQYVDEKKLSTVLKTSKE